MVVLPLKPSVIRPAPEYMGGLLPSEPAKKEWSPSRTNSLHEAENGDR